MHIAKETFKAILGKNELGSVLPLALLLIFVGFVNSSFFAVNNILDILRTASFSFIVAVPITFLMSAGGMDLSIGAVASFGGVICAFLLRADVPIPVCILVALLSGACIGILNGIVIVLFELPPFIATLGMQYAVNGVIAVTTKNLALGGFPNAFKILGQGRIFSNIPMPVIYAFAIGVIGHVMLTRTKFGRSALAIGGNQETAYLAGINVKAKRIAIYIATSLFAAFTGVLMASRFTSAQPNAGSGTELTIMASAIIGGTSMFGGSGTVFGSALGCILFATITNSLIVMHVSTFWQNLIFGIILIIAIFIDKYRRTASGRE